jgi:hypothetical protein
VSPDGEAEREAAKEEAEEAVRRLYKEMFFSCLKTNLAILLK